MRKILDKNITPEDYGAFKGCEIRNSGVTITFIMACGESYDVPIDYFNKWHSMPHEIKHKGRWITWNATKFKVPSKKNVRFLRWRHIATGWNDAVKVYLSNDTAYIIPWDTVLMSCERKYERFGGFTKQSKAITYEFHKYKKCK